MLKKPKKLQRISLLKKSVWRLCSEYIRKRDKGSCYTCPAKDEPKYMQAGHWKHGNTKATYFIEDNIHCQCSRCNTYLSGNLSIYTLRMIDQYGRDRVNEIDKLSKTEHYFTREELNQWKKYYQDRLAVGN